MKILKNNKSDEGFFFSEYKLDQAYCRTSVSPGILILHALVREKILPVDTIKLEYWGDIHDNYIDPVYLSDFFIRDFPDAETLQKEIDGNELSFCCWSVQCERGTPYLSGGRGIVISAMNMEDANLAKVMLELEHATYRYHTYPEKLTAYLMLSESLNLQRAVQSLQKLEAVPELFAEFSAAVSSGEYIPPAAPFEAHGHTAEQLMEEHGLHPLGAYLTLKELTEDPERAEEMLAKPRRKK